MPSKQSTSWQPFLLHFMLEELNRVNTNPKVCVNKRTWSENRFRVIAAHQKLDKTGTLTGFDQEEWYHLKVFTAPHRNILKRGCNESKR